MGGVTRLCIAIVFFCFHYVSAIQTVHLYVSPTGSDHNDGKSLTSPFRTIAKAVTLLHQHQYQDAKAYIELLAGFHNLDSVGTLHISRLATSQLTIQPFNNSVVRVSGGRMVPSGSFKHVTDQSILSRLPAAARQHVRVLHLPDVGITKYPALSSYGGWKFRTAPLEVFLNGEPLRLARWPNEGFININKLLEGENGTTFQYNALVNKPASWQHENDLWTYGYWRWSWHDQSIKVKSITPSNHTVTITNKPAFGMTTGHWGNQSTSWGGQGGYFKFLNVLSELDMPGEYYVDRQSGNMYVWMPSGDGSLKTSDVIQVSILEDCISIDRSHKSITLRGFTVEACRRYGINALDSYNVQLLDMEVRNTGYYNIRFWGDCRNSMVARCLLHNGDGGVKMYGGNRAKLESSGNIIENNEVVRFAREGGVGSHGIYIVGVGNIVRYNHVHIGQYTGIQYHGNDNIMEYNHVHHVCMNASDCGAFHTGRDWTTRNNLIRYNIVHDTLRLVPGADVRGVMLDDQSSSTIITNNVFYHNDVHVNIGGGRDNVVNNNVMYDAQTSSMQVDGRGQSHKYDPDLYRHLNAVPYNSTLWTSHYPALKDFLNKHPEQPRGNQIHKNLVYNKNGKEFVRMSHGINKDNYFNITENGYSRGAGDFVDVTESDFRLQCHAATWANRVGFVQVLTLNDVGPRQPAGTPHNKIAIRPIGLGHPSQVCATKAPAIQAPMPAYLPDGSRTNDLVNVSKQGCFMSVTTCTDHPSSHVYEDKYGETYEHAGENETACLARAAEQWIFCGSHKSDEITAVYGPTGAMTTAGVGCYMAMYGCPKQSGPADGHVVPGKMFRDTYAEQQRNASRDEEGCLARALTEWKWCGSNPNHPVTSIFRPKGTFRTAGSGCWIHLQKCPSYPSTKSMFYDAYGATNFNTDHFKDACFSRAADYWEYCGSHRQYPVTAQYRPKALSYTYP